MMRRLVRSTWKPEMKRFGLPKEQGVEMLGESNGSAAMTEAMKR